MPASYEYVNWQPDDEATSAKFKQMADNEQWIHDNILTGDLIYRAGANDLTNGRTVGSQIARDLYGIYVPFDSLVPASFFDVTITYPPVFTTPPVVLVTISSGGLSLCGEVIWDSVTTHAVYRVFRRDGAAVMLRGQLNVILLGT